MYLQIDKDYTRIAHDQHATQDAGVKGAEYDAFLVDLLGFSCLRGAQILSSAPVIS